MKRATVIIPFYNEELHLEECLDSLRRQSDQDLVFLMLDNASEDKSGEIADKFHKTDERFAYIRHPQNIGVALSCAYGYGLCDTEYVSFIGAHDFLSGSLVSAQLALLDESAHVSMAAGCPLTVDESGGAKERITALYDFSDTDPVQRYAKSVAMLCDCTIFQSMFRKAYLSHIDIMRYTVIHGDHIIISQLLWHGTLAFLPGNHYFRREYNSNGSGSAQRAERITGSTVIALDNRDFITTYLLSCQRLSKDLPDGGQQLLAWMKKTLEQRFP